jgi:two-component system chemotaxis response regulator CheY
MSANRSDSTRKPRANPGTLPLNRGGESDELFKDIVIENTSQTEPRVPAPAHEAPEVTATGLTTGEVKTNSEASTGEPEDWAVVVDDSLASSNIVCGILKSVGLGSHNFRSATSALQYLRQASEADFSKIMVVFSDLQMPGMNGLEFLTELRREPRTKNLPFVVISGHIDKQTLPKFAPLKIDGYIIKPFKSQSIIDRITHLNTVKGKAKSA